MKNQDTIETILADKSESQLKGLILMPKLWNRKRIQ